MGLMELLFGPDGIGGEPGLAGKAGKAVWQGTGELPEGAGVGQTLANSLGNIPHMLTDIAIKNPLEILKNPASALNDQGQVSITRLLFPDFRRERVKEDADRAKLRDAYTQAQVMNTYEKIMEPLFGPASGMSPAEGAAAARAAGAPADLVAQAQTRDYRESAMFGDARNEARKMGLPDFVANQVQPEDLPSLYNQVQDNTRADAAAARTEARQDAADARAERGLTLRELREQRLGRSPETPGGKFRQKLRERAATKAHDATFEQTQEGFGTRIPLITDPGLQGQLRQQLPAFSAKQAEKEANKILEEATPLSSRRNIAARRAGKLALHRKRKEAEAAETAATNPGSDALPVDPAERAALAGQIAADMLGAGMPPEKVVNELLARGFSVEEIPE